VFDGDCPFCIASVRWLERLRVVPAGSSRPWQSYEGERAALLLDAGIRNEIVALDPESGETRSGVRGVVWAQEGSWASALARLLTLPGAGGLANLAYRTLAFNRRVIAPARRPAGMACACDPDFHAGYRALWILVAVHAALGLAWLFGASFPVPGADASSGGTALASGRALRFLALATPGWWLAAGLGSFLGRERYADWVGHLATTALLGSAALLPGILAALVLEGRALHAVQWASLLLAAVLMARAQVRRNAALGIGQRWTAIWAGSLALGCVPFSIALTLRS